MYGTQVQPSNLPSLRSILLGVLVGSEFLLSLGDSPRKPTLMRTRVRKHSNHDLLLFSC